MKKTESNRAPAAQSSTPAAQSKVPPPQTTASFRPSATVAGNQVDPSRDPRLPRDPHTSKLAASLATPDSRAAPTQPRSQPASTATDQVVGKGRYQIAELSLQRKALEQRIQQLCNLTYCFEIPAIAEISEAYVAFVTQYLQSGTSLSQELVESNMRLAQGAMEKHLIIHQQITRLWDSLQEDHSRLLKEVIALPEDCQE
ncbi:MAG: hypothetical protein LQ349_002108 [Xanthoria aureola]|nr:MAG: hypothetical protein LQ349_002108 [Xanthoria aureola]